MKKVLVKPKGLGDLIENITFITGIQLAVKKTIGGCGCEERKEKLNKLVPFK